MLLFQYHHRLLQALPLRELPVPLVKSIATAPPPLSSSPLLCCRPGQPEAQEAQAGSSRHQTSPDKGEEHSDAVDSRRPARASTARPGGAWPCADSAGWQRLPLQVGGWCCLACSAWLLVHAQATASL